MTSSIPRVVEQALDDVHLPATARLMMWHLQREWVELHLFREVKLTAVAHAMRIKETTAGQMMTLLVERGYLECQPMERRARAYRFPWNRRRTQAVEARAA